jgi:hypothetical protein
MHDDFATQLIAPHDVIEMMVGDKDVFYISWFKAL